MAISSAWTRKAILVDADKQFAMQRERIEANLKAVEYRVKDRLRELYKEEDDTPIVVVCRG